MPLFKSAKLFFFAGVLLVVNVKLTAQNKLAVDSLNRLIARESNDSQKVNYYNQVAIEFRGVNLSITDSFANMAIHLGEKCNFHKGIGKAYISKAIVCRNAANYQQALENCRWAMVHFIKADELSGYSAAYNTIASIHYAKGDFSLAQLYYFHSLRYSELIADRRGEARTLNNIGVLYMDRKDYNKALIYYKKSYGIMYRLKDANGMADCLNNMGGIYQYQLNFDLAIRNYAEALAINKSLGENKDISSSLNNLGCVFQEKGDYKAALDLFQQSLILDEQLGDINAIVVSNGNISNCYLKLRMFHAANRYASEALNLSRAFGQKTNVMDAYEMLYKIAEEEKNYEKAFSNHKLFKAYSDSIFNASTTGKIEFLERQYLKEKTEKEELIRTKQSELSKIIYQEKESHIQQYIFIIGMVLLLFVVLIYVVFFILKRSPEISSGI